MDSKIKVSDVFVKTGDINCVTETLKDLTEHVWKYDSSMSNINIHIKDENTYDIIVVINNNIRRWNIATELEVLGFEMEDQIY